MDCKIWFNQALHRADNRTLKIGFRKSARILNKSAVFSQWAPNEIIEGLWKLDSPMGPFDDPALHQELDRLMARMRIT